MKQVLSLFCTLIVFCTVLCTTAAATDFDSIAQELSAIGVFRGTGDSFELDREPTRAEAAVMLVRLYGAEEQAQSDYANGIITHPFTDVPGWTAPYVAWLYTNGLTKGMSDTTFGSTSICTDLNYTTFLLRALGYQDGVDFNYKEALSFAQELGFYNAEAFAGPFLRDDLAALTYQALATNVKSGETYLLAQLIANGAVDAEAARPMTEKMDAWHSFSAQLFQENTAYECETIMKCDAVATLNDTDTAEISTSATTYTAQIGNDENLQYVETVTEDYMGVPAGSSIYIKDGWVYYEEHLANYPLAQYKYPFTPDFIEETDIVTEENLVSLPSYGGILILENISVEYKADTTVYTITIRDSDLASAFADLIDNLDPESMGEILSLKYENAQIVYTFDADGQLLSSSTKFSFSLEAQSYAQEDEDPIRMRIDAEYDVTTTFIGWNDDVQIIFPDFSDYQEIMEEDYQ